jgi:UDP-N-acetylmuramate--alanine ligase
MTERQDEMAVQADRNQMSQTWQARLADRDRGLHIHILGIGGAGMSPIAKVLLEQGLQVSGSDRQASPTLQALANLGARTVIGQTANNLTGLAAAELPDLVLTSSAVDVNNPERQAALRLGLPVVKRDAFLPALLVNRQVIAIAGTAGKSTTTAMIVKVLRDAGLDVGYIIGADLPGYGNAVAGTNPYFVIEADEYDHMFLGLKPAVAVITNVVWDHPDCYPTPESFWQAFQQFVGLVDASGLVVTCADDLGAERLYELRRTSGPTWITYGLADYADVRAVNLAMIGGEQQAELMWWHAPKGQLTLQAPGAHNISNALAALAVANWCDVPFATAIESLRGFTGAARRFEIKGIVKDVTVIDDYAHHPTKVRATLLAARQRFPAQRIWAVFQPHTYSRTKQLLPEFGQSLANADQVIITDIFAAREVDDGSVSAEDLVAAMTHPPARHISGLAAVADYLAAQVRPDDVVVVMGAGDSYKIGDSLLTQLRVNA